LANQSVSLCLFVPVSATRSAALSLTFRAVLRRFDGGSLVLNALKCAACKAGRGKAATITHLKFPTFESGLQNALTLNLKDMTEGLFGTTTTTTMPTPMPMYGGGGGDPYDDEHNH